MDLKTFRVLRQEFNRPDLYPDLLVEHYLKLACENLDHHRWASWLDEGTLDFVSHYLVAARRNAQSAQAGGTPGGSTGLVSSKSVGGVSISYDVGSTTVKDGDNFNSTTYGVAFLHRARLVGSGGVQITGGSEGFGLDGRAWAGPPEWNFLSEPG